MRRYIITGSHSVGKTSLCEGVNLLLRGNYDIRVIPEIARLLIAKGIPMNDKADEFSIISYLLEYLKLWRESEADIILADRGVLDLYAYISVKRPSVVRDEFVELVYEMMLRESKSIDAYVYLPIEFRMKQDNVRPNDEEYQLLIDGKIQEIMWKIGAPLIEVSGSLNERVEKVVGLLDA